MNKVWILLREVYPHEKKWQQGSQPWLPNQVPWGGSTNALGIIRGREFELDVEK